MAGEELQRERLWENHLTALSKFCCPAQSDKEATGTASSVSSLINLLIRLNQQRFSGVKPHIPPPKSLPFHERTIYFPLPFFPQALFVSLMIIFKVKVVALNRMPHLTIRYSKQAVPKPLVFLRGISAAPPLHLISF